MAKIAAIKTNVKATKATRTVKVSAADLQHIGHTAFGDDDGRLVILGRGEGWERILLREILAITGDRIVEIGDFVWDSGACDTMYITSYRWKRYYDLY